MDVPNTRAHVASVRMEPALAAVGRFARRAARPVMLSVCVFLASLVRWLGVPSPFAAALLVSVGDKSNAFTLLGLGAGFALRLMWGVESDLWQYVGCLALWLLRLRVKPREGLECAALAGLAMLPRALALLLGEHTAMELATGLAAIPVAMLSSAALRGVFSALRYGAPTPDARERISAALLGLLLIGGLGYFRLLGVSLGQSAAVLAMLMGALLGGAAGGAVCGLAGGLALALIGHDCAAAFSLALCGLACGLVPKRRWLMALVALAVNLLAFMLSARLAPPLGFGAVALGAALSLIVPPSALDRLRGLFATRAGAGLENRFISQRIDQLRSAVQDVAEALPTCGDTELSGGVELGEALCAQCVNREACWLGGREQTERMLGAVMELGQSGRSTADLTLLERHGCLRAGAIDELARDVLAERGRRRAARVRARFERDLTLTHLSAMSDTLRELEALSAGDSMSDLRAAHILTQAMEVLGVPARLDYARRVDGRLQASLRSESVLPLQRHLEALLRYLDEHEGLALSIARAARGRVDLEEIPLYSAAIGTATLCAAAHGETDELCGDACRVQRCDGGRLLMMLSDGMGHGEQAHAQSEKTLELLEKLLEAGYSRRQAITAANGVMLSTQESESFATVDLCDIDLWTGDIFCEKLGACASWIVRGSHYRKLEGASLPLGVMEQAAPTSAQHRLHSGDILVMTSDGVTDLFPEDEDMRRLLGDSLFIQPQRMADAILRNALVLSDGKPKDDMCVMVMLLMDRRRGVM